MLTRIAGASPASYTASTHLSPVAKLGVEVGGSDRSSREADLAAQAQAAPAQARVPRAHVDRRWAGHHCATSPARAQEADRLGVPPTPSEDPPRPRPAGSVAKTWGRRRDEQSLVQADERPLASPPAGAGRDPEARDAEPRGGGRQGTPGRLRRTRDFALTMRTGRRARHPLVHLVARSTGLPETRVGYAVGRRVGKAVARNRARRRLREIIRVLPLRPGFDLVLIGQPGVESAPFAEIQRAVVSNVARLGLINDR
jgi:ribonuclease P protein component